MEQRGWTLATVESCTGGLVAAAITSIPGSSNVFKGGMVPYSVEMKIDLLGVDQGMISASGVVSEGTAEQMALSIMGRMGANMGIATTGVAGPEPMDNRPPGTVIVAVAYGDPAHIISRTFCFTGDREHIRRQATDAALSLAVEILVGQSI